MSYAEKSDAQFFREVEEEASTSYAKSSTRKTEKKEKETKNDDDKSDYEDSVENLSVSPSKKSKKVETPKKKPGPKSKTAKKIGKSNF